MLKPDLIVFDCDGVLVDSEDLQAQVFAETLAAHGLAFTSDYCRAHFRGLSLADCYRLLEAASGRALPAAFAADLADATLRAFTHRLRPVEGARQVLTALGIAGVPYAVASNGSVAKMRHSLGCAGLLELVRGRLFSAAGMAPKPAPDVFLLAARACGVEPGRVWVIEDSETGLRAARSAGMTAWELASGTAGAGRLPHLTALLDWL